MIESKTHSAPIKSLSAFAGLDGAPILLRLMRATGWVTVGNIASRMVSLAIAFVMARQLSAAEFGAFGIIQNTLNMFHVVAGLSLGLAATRYVAASGGAGPQRQQEVVFFVVAAGAAAALATTFVMVVLAPWLTGKVLGHDSLSDALRWSALQLFFAAGYGILTGVLGGLEWFGRSALCAVIQNFVILLCAVLFIPSFGLTGAIQAHVVGFAGALLLGAWYLRSMASGFSWTRVHDCWRRQRKILREFCLPHILSGAVSLSATWLATLIIVRQPGGLVEIGFFSAAERFRFLIIFVAGFVGSALLPILSGTWAQASADQRSEQSALELGLFATGSLVLPLTCLLAFAGPEMMALFGKDYAVNWAVLLPVLAWAGVGAIGSVIGIALIAGGQQWFLFLQQLFYGATLLALTYSLRDQGGVGLAIAHGVAALLLLAWSYPVVKRSQAVSARAARLLVSLTCATCSVCVLAYYCPVSLRLIMVLPAVGISLSALYCSLARQERSQLWQLFSPTPARGDF